MSLSYHVQKKICKELIRITKTIQYNGKTFETKFYHEISDEEFERIRNEHYRKPPFEKVQEQFVAVANGKNTNGLITKFYVKDLMEKTKKRKSKFTMEEVFASKELVGFLYGKSLSNPKVYNSSDTVKNMETVCRIGGSGCVWASASNFPLEAVDLIIQKYDRNGVVYDYSCGWGSRMLGSIRNGVTYCGTDPNYLLVERLTQMIADYAQATGNNVRVDIRAHGSETLVPEWGGRVGLAFSSPPYFDEEDYAIGEQSYKQGMSYTQWLESYMVPTIRNIYIYLTQDGVFCINVKNLGKYKLEDDVVRIAQNNGFELFEIERLRNHKRPHAQLGLVDNSEKIFCFRKAEAT